MLRPLAERMRPTSLDNYVGQQHLIGPNGVLRKMIDSQQLSSFILWGPPGVGKTTLARIAAYQLACPFYTLSAVSAGVKEVREVIERARSGGIFERKTPILFIDEIHRFNKAQQDSLLAAVEEGVFVLIGATTENPSFEVITPLLSRCQVYTLKALEDNDLQRLLNRAIAEDSELRKLTVHIEETDNLFRFAGGDARKLLNILDLMCRAEGAQQEIVINNQTVLDRLQENPMAYDKNGELHYDIISAFIKSIRGSDPDAAIYWLARMVEGGEDPKFIARRLLISAAEDIGLANPNALLLANTCFDAIQKIGWPEARIILAETTIYLAYSPKSNSAYLAIDKAIETVKKTGNLAVPLHLRNAPTQLMKEMAYGQDYLYPHDYPGNFVEQSYLPEALLGKSLWTAQENAAEKKSSDFLKQRWKHRF